LKERKIFINLNVTIKLMSDQTPIFLSHPTPHLKKQEDFISNLSLLLQHRGLCARTVKLSHCSIEEPLHLIRQAMSECNGLIAVAFKRTLITNGIIKPGCDNGSVTSTINSKWLSSPYSHIEPAMAFQIGLPVLILKEKEIIPEGILEKEIPGIYLREFILEENISIGINEIIKKWEWHVKRGAEKKLRSIA
jgi:hypothetical protein